MTIACCARLRLSRIVPLLLLVSLFLSSSSVFAEDEGAAVVDNPYVATTTTDDDNLLANLETMTEAELEALCVDRGFELIRSEDPENKNPIEYTREDYIDAARECLAIEAEMDAYIADHPEVLESLKSEAKRLLEEAADLERQLEAAAASQPPRNSDTAFVRSEASDHSYVGLDDSDDETNASYFDGTEAPPPSQADDLNRDASSEHEPVTEPEKAFVTTEIVEDAGGEEVDIDAIIDLDLLEEDIAKDVADEENAASSHVSDATDASSSEPNEATSLPLDDEASSRPPTSSDEFTLQAILKEGLAQMRRDFEFIIKKLRPLKPYWDDQVRPALVIAGNVAKRTGLEAYDMTLRYIRAFQESRRTNADDKKEKIEGEAVATAA